ncbi:MAG: hypothetical protein CVU38_19485 [Chloroflexi bacterium HGW-Chloroflexi-1]|nr:MAG: hypothetical protein CVU38_19485 [Chloroflexi bacterium HGW-Chloroflexi-1]
MVLDIWGNMLVVGIGAREGQIIGVGLRIIPVQLLAIQPDLVPIVQDLTGGEIYQFRYTQLMSTAKRDGSYDDGCSCAGCKEA